MPVSDGLIEALSDCEALLEVIAGHEGETAMGAMASVMAEKTRAALEAAALDAQGAQWQPIETMPKDDTLFLAYCPPDEQFPTGRMMIWRGSFLNMQDARTPRHLQYPATHWMPLPAAPQPSTGR